VVPVSIVLEVFPSLSNINCLVHLYVEMLQFFIVSILDGGERISLGICSPFCGLVASLFMAAPEMDGADTIIIWKNFDIHLLGCY